MKILENSPRKPRQRIIVLLLLLAIAVVLSFFANSFILKRTGKPLPSFLYRVSANYLRSFKVTPERVYITIKANDLDQISKHRDASLERGMIENYEGSYVPASLKFQDKDIDIRLRLKGHMTDHIEGSKWSFRVNIKGNDNFKGMRLFSLQHPGTRGYIYEWIYHRLMQREDIISLRYGFIELYINGESKGIYAYEENFDEELIENNKRRKGPVFRFNPDFYWVDRYNELVGDRVNAEYATYSSADFEPYRKSKVLKDSSMRKLAELGIALMQQFREGKLNTSEVFDIPRLARFHAIIDLVGGHHSLDWSDVKYYLNPVTQRLEPVAYESFSVNPVREIAGSYKFIGDTCPDCDLHARIFSDPDFFSEYIQALEKVSEREYLDSFFQQESDTLLNNLTVLNREFPYKVFEEEVYYRNQNSIRRILDIEKGFHAWISTSGQDSIVVTVQAMDAFPLILNKLIIGSNEIPLNILLPSKVRRNSNAPFKKFKVAAGNIRQSDLQNAFISYKIPGSKLLKKAEVFTYKAPDSDLLDPTFFKKRATLTKGLVKTGSKLSFSSLSPVISGTVFIDKEEILFIPPGAIVKMEKGAIILCYGKIIINGTPENPVHVVGAEDAGLILAGKEKSIFSNAKFSGFSNPTANQIKYTGAITIYESKIDIVRCAFDKFESEDGLTIIRSEFNISECAFTNFANDAIDCQFSNGTVRSTAFSSCGEDALNIMNSSVNILQAKISKCGNKGINGKARSVIILNELELLNCNTAISAEDETSITGTGIFISDSPVGIWAGSNKKIFKGSSSVKLNKVIFKNVRKKTESEKKSIIKIDEKVF